MEASVESSVVGAHVAGVPVLHESLQWETEQSVPGVLEVAG